MYDEILVTTIKGHRATIVRVQGYDPIAEEYLRAKGEAIRHPDDKHDDALATTLATGRALSSLGRKLQRRANGRIKCNDDNARRPNVSEESLDYFVNTLDKDAFTESGKDRCQGTKVDGEQCTRAAQAYSAYCGHHKGAF